MKFAWNGLLAILPHHWQDAVDKLGRHQLRELRLRLGRKPELVVGNDRYCLPDTVTQGDIRYVINMASRYSPWAAESTARGYLTAKGGHRIGLCGTVIAEDGWVKGFREITSLCIRVARDFPDLGKGLAIDGNLLILGPPGSGKTTMLRSVCRSVASQETVAVVDERGEIFPVEFETGRGLDVIRNCTKLQGIEMVLRTMGPDTIAVDEITAAEDAQALLHAGWCGVRLIATAHASCPEDLHKRKIYLSLVEAELFPTVLVMERDFSWRMERLVE